MNQHRLPSDVIGLSKVMPPLSRRGFMSTSAAASAGYTLAAGPVRADAIHTDTNGLNAGMGSVAVQGGNMPVYFARPVNAANPPVILIAMEIFGLHEWVKDITRRVGHLGAFAIAPNYYFRLETNGVDLTKIDDIQKLLTAFRKLIDGGASILVIEHNLDIIKSADWIIDLGPEGGAQGGRIVATGTPEQVARNSHSYTGKFLARVLANSQGNLNSAASHSAPRGK